jgi:VCBS repeat-containing protein
MYDGLHPNPSGYGKMAGEWFDTLETFMLPAEVPEITSPAVTNVALGSIYQYTATAIGPPNPTYNLVTSPAGMTVDAQSGLIQWDPPATGSYDVTVRATNWAGTDEQSFTISVSSEPQAQGDAYASILEGGSLVVTAANGVLENDTIVGGSLTAELVTDVAHGTLTLNSDGGFIYVHDGSEIFSDSFTYKATFGALASETVTVDLTITPQNDAPTITGQGALSGKAGDPIQISLSNLIFSDPDDTVPVDHTLSVEEGSNYTLSGSDTVIPDTSFSGDLLVTVRVSDGTDLSDPFDLTITVTAGGTTTTDGGGGGGGCFVGSLGY